MPYKRTGRPGGAPRGHPKWGGRKIGTPNNATLERVKTIAEAYEDRTLTEEEIAEITPLDAILLVLRRRIVAHDDPGVLQAAVAAAPFCHAKLVASDVRVHHDTARLGDDELARELVSLRRRIEAARAAETLPLIEARAEPVEVASPAGASEVAKRGN